jgi:hypothetical protein
LELPTPLYVGKQSQKNISYFSVRIILKRRFFQKYLLKKPIDIPLTSVWFLLGKTGVTKENNKLKIKIYVNNLTNK